MAVSHQTTNSGGGGGVCADDNVALHCDRVGGRGRGVEGKESESSAVGGSE